MKRNVIVFGLIAGVIVTIMMVITTTACYNNPNYAGSMLIGYTSMLIAFAFIFVSVKNYRDKHNNGHITFGKAFLMGLYIALIASTMYVVAWLFEYYLYIPDFMQKYTAHVLKEAADKGATKAQLAAQMADMAGYVEMYKTPFGVILLTYMEILPVGLVVALISALILKRKAPTAPAV